MHPCGNYEVEFKHRPSILDNVKSWKVFEEDKQIQNFLTLTGNFDGLNIDEKDALLEGPTLIQESLSIQDGTSKDIS